MDVKFNPLLCIGGMLLLQGTISLIFISSTGFVGAFGEGILMIPIGFLIAGATVLIFGLVFSMRAKSEESDFYEAVSKSYKEKVETRSTLAESELIALECPKCGAPIKSKPPCFCEFCGFKIDILE